MFLEEIVLDGFKSYAERTVVPAFDPQFNAITGLNGAGKSNILDGICFVLGITNLTQVRVGSLQELVYKKGQAGVSKASVTLVFNNSDASSSPLGYEQYEKITITRQVMIGGKSKYLVNGHTATVTRVQNLFHSVQLNVNNPHFLIMQGRITKVLNMKPPEILSMIEEAAGTRMFENKKTAALKTIAKKQLKVEEINRILAEDITPTLEKLRTERTQYLKWSANNTECERLARFCTAYEYVKAQKLADQSETVLGELRERLQTLETEISTHQTIVQTKEQQIKQIEAEKQATLGAEYQEVVKREEKLSKQLVKANTAWKNKQAALEDEKKQYAKCEQQYHEAKATVEQLMNQLTTQQESASSTIDGAKQATKHLDDLQKQYQAVTSGVGSTDDDSCTLQGQLLQARKATKEAETEISTCERRLSTLEEQKQVILGKLQASQDESQNLINELNAAENEVDTLDKSIKTFKKKTNFNVDKVKSLKERREKLSQTLRQLDDLIEGKEAQLNAKLQFGYDTRSMPRGFSAEKVKGIVAKLVSVEDKTAATALEVTAGGKLYQVVVDTQETGKALLTHGRLKRRVTIIPLNKIKHSSISRSRIEAAEAASGDASKVRTALGLVGYSDDVSAAMEYVFGNHFICNDSNTAKRVTFDKNVRAPSVTLEGDSFDPSGTLEGGANANQANGSSVLLQLQVVQELVAKRDATQMELKEISTKLASFIEIEKELNVMNQKFDLAKHTLSLVQARTKDSVVNGLKETLDTIQAQIQSTTQEIEKAQNALQQHQKRADDLARDVEDSVDNREGVVKRLESDIKQCRSETSTLQEEARKLEDQIEETRLELEQAHSDVTTCQKAMEQGQTSVSSCEADVQKLEEDVAETSTLYEAARKELDGHRSALSNADSQLKQLTKECDLSQRTISNAQTELKRITHKLNKHDSEVNQAKKRVEQLEQTYEWITHDKHLFGRPTSDYDFEASNPQKATQRLKELESTQSQLGRKINKKVLGMIETAEREYTDLMSKRKIIENDKTKIERVICELDEKKKQALKTTWTKVNRDFGSIFSTLLPGTMAKLEPPEGQDVLSGLEVKVAFGNVWKESLSELSGGQRSLLALSLILALLLFKPAPMYILDEIDAALDPSHTQNIGKMLRTHFKSSQFIVVSLKQGMFNNANVVFRAKFVNGVSTVTRSVPPGAITRNGPISSTQRLADTENAAAFFQEQQTLKRARGTNNHPTQTSETITNNETQL